MISRFFLFEMMSEQEIQYLLDHSNVRDYEAGVFLFKEGDPSDYFSVILEGEVEVIKGYETSVERLVQVLSTGDFFGEMSLVYRVHNRTASVRTRTAVRMLEIHNDEFQALVQQNARLSYRMMQVLIERML